MEGNQPPTPPPIAPPPGEWEQPPVPAPGEFRSGALQDVADKVGLLPNFRKQDNLFQLKWVAIGTALGAVVLQVWNPLSGAPFGVGLLLGAIGGMLVATVITGTILAIRNLKR